MGAPAHFIANRLALDFVNTGYGVGAAHCDCLADEESTRAWLAQAGVVPDTAHLPAPLSRHARKLRDIARDLINAARSGQACDTGPLNTLLAAGQRIPGVAWDPSQERFAWAETRRDTSAASMLHPVVLDLAQLLTGNEVAAIHQCEAHDCTLLFLDPTTSRRRRWCSMAACGNRMKVAAFRTRKQAS